MPEKVSLTGARQRLAVMPFTHMVPKDQAAFEKAHDEHVAHWAERPDERPPNLQAPGGVEPRPVKVVHTLLDNRTGGEPMDAGLWTLEDVEAAIKMALDDEYPGHRTVESTVADYGIAGWTPSGT
jgi:hypothetical protein